SLESARDHCEAWSEFSVPESWLKDEGIGPLDIVMIHYHDDAWQVLETGYLGTTDTMATYRARCTGFSYFAITVLPGEATLVETPAPTLTMGVNESIHATPSGAPTATLAQAPAKTETTTPPKEVPPQTTPQESPIWATVPFCALAVAVFGALRRP
ncbi:MAG: PGF-pre-PGF domain-containing protein, partial [Methanofollis sp.]|nr:PGF-pre-PGF domain-containing protein [Methanofollis sp.]